MSQIDFKALSKQKQPKKQKLKNCMMAFVGGGTIGFMGEVLLFVYKEYLSLNTELALALMILTFIAAAALLTGLGYFDKLGQIFGAGVFIPITGFANAMVSSALEGKSEGPIYGIGASIFKLAGAVLTYGVSFAFLFNIIRYVWSLL